MPREDVEVAGGPHGRGYIATRRGRRIHARGYLASRGSHVRPSNAANPEVEEFNRALRNGEIHGDQFEVGPMSAKQAVLVAKAQARVAKQQAKQAKQTALQAKLEAKYAKAESKIALSNAKEVKEAAALDRAQRGVKLSLWGRLTGSGKEKPIRGVAGKLHVERAE
jgi:hypothetical protein